MRRLDLEYTSFERFCRESSIPEEWKDDFLANPQECWMIMGSYEGKPVFWAAIFRKSSSMGELFIHIEDSSFVMIPIICRDLIDHTFMKGNFTTLEASVASKNPKHSRFVEWLGFEYQYSFIFSDGENYDQYSRSI